jgi:diguanylate cyclase (GGDEF)-like protein
MKNIRQYFFTPIPREYKNELAIEINKENLLRMMIGQIAVALVEIILLVLFTPCARWLVNLFIFFNVGFFPVFLLSYHKKMGHRLWGKFIQYIYMVGTLIYSAALVFLSDGELGAIRIFVYLIAVFAIAAFINIRPLAGFILFFSVYICFFYLLSDLFSAEPYAQFNALTFVRANALAMNAVAWVLSVTVYNLRVTAFIDKAIILEQNAKLKDLAMRDSMTMLLNHEYIYKRLGEEIQRADRLEHTFSVIMIDIDDFKSVNDSYGHQTGDKIIFQVARLLVNTCRGTDIVGRYGGEEFMIIMPDTPLQNAVNLTDRIRKAVENTQFEKGIKISLSGGLCEYQGESAEELIRKVDQQLYKAKAEGKNKFEQALSPETTEENV